ncbi:MAG: hypothetical protein DMG97_27805 [Acidobacteria bacterium]|nr:MAG: hypothetical protein DMG97_27805 [Acidobacteriota bacterium]
MLRVQLQHESKQPAGQSKRRIRDIGILGGPNTRVSDPIVQALSKWEFRPPLLNNQPVAVNVLIGIRL